MPQNTQLSGFSQFQDLFCGVTQRKMIFMTSCDPYTVLSALQFLFKLMKLPTLQRSKKKADLHVEVRFLFKKHSGPSVVLPTARCGMPPICSGPKSTATTICCQAQRRLPSRRRCCLAFPLASIRCVDGALQWAAPNRLHTQTSSARHRHTRYSSGLTHA